MNKEKLPSNLYCYEPTLLGIPLKKLLIIFLGVALGLLSFRLNFLLPVPVIILFIVSAFFKYGDDTVFHKFSANISYLFRKKIFTVSYDLKFVRFNSHLLGIYRNTLSELAEIKGMDIIHMRNSDQISIYSGLQKAIDEMDLDLDIVSVPKIPKENAGSPGIREYRDLISSLTEEAIHYVTYVRFILKLENRTVENVLEPFCKSIDHFYDKIGIYEFKTRKIASEGEFRELLTAIIS